MAAVQGRIGVAKERPDRDGGTSRPGLPTHCITREQDLMESTGLSLRRVYKGPFPATTDGYYSLVQPARRRCFVYVLFDDAGEVVYVGKSFRPGNRFDRHRRKPWWDAVATIAILQIDGPDRYLVERAAFAAELDAIHTLHPRHNIVGVLA